MTCLLFLTALYYYLFDQITTRYSAMPQMQSFRHIQATTKAFRTIVSSDVSVDHCQGNLFSGVNNFRSHSPSLTFACSPQQSTSNCGISVTMTFRCQAQWWHRFTSWMWQHRSRQKQNAKRLCTKRWLHIKGTTLTYIFKAVETTPLLLGCRKGWHLTMSEGWCKGIIFQHDINVSAEMLDWVSSTKAWRRDSGAIFFNAISTSSLGMMTFFT